MRVLLLLVLMLSILADDAADSYLCFSQPTTTINSILEDDDDDDERHHHRSHCECQHEDDTQATQAGKQLQTSHHKHCNCQFHHGLYWVPISAHNLLPPNCIYLRLTPANDRFVVEDFDEGPFRPPMRIAA